MRLAIVLIQDYLLFNAMAKDYLHIKFEYFKPRKPTSSPIINQIDLILQTNPHLDPSKNGLFDSHGFWKVYACGLEKHKAG